MPLDIDQLKLYTAHRGIAIPMLDFLQFRHAPAADGVGPGCLVLRVEPQHLNGWANAHGGLIMTLLDVAMALSASDADEAGRGVVTVEMKTNFLRPGGEVGEVLEAHGSVRHHTRSIAFCEAELRNGAGVVVASSSGTFKYVNKPRPLADA
ncbi:PaaI family thioesterase [Pseudomonas sp. PDNC002]|uniref:PaaI family thioesterase n=1 Tax=Pseudomonas sp. PDNC002 TaxID=2811422 RepID=UPI001965F15F|nr:PaaI family thioesterase [Pseudomonas sp. PDNC002]QRY78302.1 PaaI family thioesterase [Pseudomonas sp. PDNC002]